jgi:hypothetical protein
MSTTKQEITKMTMKLTRAIVSLTKTTSHNDKREKGCLSMIPNQRQHRNTKT